SAVARVLSRRSLVAVGFRLGSAWRVQHGAEIGKVVSSFCRSHQTDSDDFLSPSLQIGAEIGRVVSSFCRSHHLVRSLSCQIRLFGFLFNAKSTCILLVERIDPRFRRGEKGQEHDGSFSDLFLSYWAPEGEGSLPCDGFNHVFDLVKKGNKAFRDNSFEEQAIHLLASICVNYNLDFQKEKERVENVIQKERQRVAKLEAIVTKLSTTVLKAADEPFSYIDQDSMASDDEEAQTSEKDDD
ncbi:hypothetical protein LINPERHAP2_LOCUS9709, partial [Linum perenne]